MSLLAPHPGRVWELGLPAMGAHGWHVGTRRDPAGPGSQGALAMPSLGVMEEQGDVASWSWGRRAALGGQGSICLHWGAAAVPTLGRALRTLGRGTRTPVGG